MRISQCGIYLMNKTSGITGGFLFLKIKNYIYLAHSYYISYTHYTSQTFIENSDFEPYNNTLQI